MPRRKGESAATGRTWKVGELAEQAGLTVRTLHHYDAAGLLRPRGRTESAHGSGHRLYTADDVARLQQIVSLKQLGFSLEEVREFLAHPDHDPRRVVRLHLERVRGRAAELKRLEGRLAALSDALDRGEVVSADEFLATIKEMAMIEKYYTPEQLARLRDRREAVGEERMLSVQRDWAELHAEVAAAMSEGVDPADPRAQDLARRWFALIDEFTGGDPGIFRSLQAMYQDEDNIRNMDVAAMRPAMEYIGRAAVAAEIRMPGS